MTTKTLTNIIKTYHYPSKQAFIDQAVEEKIRRLQQLEFFTLSDQIKHGIEQRGYSIRELEEGLTS